MTDETLPTTRLEKPKPVKPKNPCKRCQETAWGLYETALERDPVPREIMAIKYGEHKKCLIAIGTTLGGKVVATVTMGLSEAECIQTFAPVVAAGGGSIDFVKSVNPRDLH